MVIRMVCAAAAATSAEPKAVTYLTFESFNGTNLIFPRNRKEQTPVPKRITRPVSNLRGENTIILV